MVVRTRRAEEKRLAALERVKELTTRVCGVAFEMTVTGDNSFTLSAENDERAAAERLADYFGKLGHSARVEFFEDCDLTCLYVVAVR